MKAFSRALISILIAALVLPSQAQQGSADSRSGNPTALIELSPGGSNYSVKSIRFEMSYVDLKDAREETARLAGQRLDSATIISTDVEEVLEQSALEAQNANAEENNVFVLPIGGAWDERNPKVNKPGGFNVALRKLKNHTIKSIQDDKIGFMVVTYNLGLESVRWIHAAHLTNLERTANVAYTVITALMFSLNKDAWSKMTRPVQRNIRKVLGMSTVIPERAGASDLVVKFFANFLLGAAVNLARVPLLNIDEIANNAFDSTQLTPPLIIAVVGSLTGMAWSELIANIDQDANPKAKFMTRRVIEFRSLMTGMFSSTAMLLTYDVYGLAPWFTMAVSGIAGYALYLNSDRLVQWIESNPQIAGVFSRVSAAKKALRPPTVRADSLGKVLGFSKTRSSPGSSRPSSCKHAVGE